MEINETFAEFNQTGDNSSHHGLLGVIGRHFATAMVVVTAIIAVSIFILNPMTIAAIVRTPSLRRCHSNIFLINLAVVDLLIMVMIFGVIIQSWINAHSEVLCFIGKFYLGTVAVASMLFCFAIAVDRFLFIHKAMTYSVIVTHAGVIKVVTSIWAVSVIIGFIPLFDKNFTKDKCSIVTSVAVSVQGSIVFVMFCITGVISVCLYAKLFFVIRDHNKVLETHALAHCKAHDCGNHSCRIKTKLGECRFRHDSQTSSTTSRAQDRCPENDAPEIKRLIYRKKCAPNSQTATSDLKAASSTKFVQEEDFNMAVVNKMSNPASEKRSWIHGKNIVYDEGSDIHLSDIKGHFDHTNTEKRKTNCTGTHRNKTTSGKCQHLRDLRTIKTLMMMFAIYFICWAPLIVLKLRAHLFHKHTSERYINFAWVSAMSNSLWNFLVYPLRKKDLKIAMFKMLRRCLGRQESETKSRSLAKDGGNDSVHSSLKLSNTSGAQTY